MDDLVSRVQPVGRCQPRKPNDPHSGSLRGLNASRAVSNHYAIGRLVTFSGGSHQEQVRCWLACGYVVSAVDVTLETIEQVHEAQRESDPLVASG